MTTTKQRTLTQKQMFNKLERAYADQYGNVPFVLSEDWNGEEGAIKFHDAPEDRSGMPLFDYWVEDYEERNYTMGQRNHFYNFLTRNGWWFEWINSQEAMIRPF